MMNNRANEILNNWTPEVASLIATLKRHGFIILKGDNGEESFKFDGDMKNFIANLIACDEAHLYVRGPGSDKARWLFLVLGNSPGEIVCDYAVPADVDTTADPLDKATDEHYSRWEGRKQPTWTAAQAYPEIYGPAAIAEREAAIAARNTKARLEYLRGELRAERISTGELVELQSLVPHIEAGDVELLEAAGVPESVEDRVNAKMLSLCDAINDLKLPVKVFQCPKCGAELPAIKGYERATFRHCVCGNTAIRK